MLPTGHIAAGFLTAKALVAVLHPEISAAEQTKLLWWGALFGFAPDMDVFYFFLKNKTMLVSGIQAYDDSHRKFFSHTPLYWLIAGLAIFFLNTSAYGKCVGLLVWLGSWSHFILDSVEYGIPWLMPFNPRLFAFRNREYKAVITDTGFFGHSVAFLRMYSRRLSFYWEVVIIASALFVILYH